MSTRTSKSNPPDQKAVYLALKNIFKGNDAQIRQTNSIKRHICRHKSDKCVIDLLKEYSIDALCNVAKELLLLDVFESTLKAKLRFPELFDISPSQSAERDTSEAEAAKNEAHAIKQATLACQGTEVASQLNHQLNNDSGPSIKETKDSSGVQQGNPLGNSCDHALFPVYLPFKTQHLLMNKVQSILEGSCYCFCQKFMPRLLESKGWDCAESGELNAWIPILSDYFEGITLESDNIGKPLREISLSIANIRHTAVHRLRVNGKKIVQFLADAESLARLLTDYDAMKLLAKIRQETQSALGELERSKHLLAARFEDTIANIAAQRVELARLEEAAVVEMIKNDGEYQVIAGTSLEQAIVSPETIVPSLATPEVKTDIQFEETPSDHKQKLADISGKGKCRQKGNISARVLYLMLLQVMRNFFGSSFYESVE